MSTLLLTGRWVILSVNDVRSNWALSVTNGKITQGGPTPEMRQRFHGVPEFGGPDCIVLPGLINAHHHCYGLELINQAIADDFLEPWMFNSPAMVPLSQRVSTTYAAARLLRSGVTSVVDMCAAGPSLAQAEQRLAEKQAAYRQTGIRAMIAPGERWQNRIVHGTGEEAGFLATLPANLRTRLMAAEADRQRLSCNDYLTLVSNLTQVNDGLQDTWFGPTGPQWTPEPLLADIATAAERLDTRIQTHVLESHYESIESPRIRKQPVLEYLDRLGLMTGRLSLAHAVWATPEDHHLIRARNVQVAHNPGSNLRLRSGIAPAAQMKQSGVELAIGMDGTTLAGDEDMFAEMRLALNLNRAPHASAPALTAHDVLDMATRGGANLIGRADDLGQLHNGFDADAVILDAKRITNPWVHPDTDPVELILARAKSYDVQDVLVRGVPVIQDRGLVGVNEDALRDDLKAEIVRSEFPDPYARKLQQDLRPFVMNWYAQWDADAVNTHRPVTSYEARR